MAWQGWWLLGVYTANLSTRGQSCPILCAFSMSAHPGWAKQPLPRLLTPPRKSYPDQCHP